MWSKEDQLVIYHSYNILTKNNPLDSILSLRLNMVLLQEQDQPNLAMEFHMLHLSSFYKSQVYNQWSMNLWKCQYNLQQ